MVILIVVCVLVGTVALAALYDYRARLRGGRAHVSVENAIHHRMPRMFVHRYATRERK